MKIQITAELLDGVVLAILKQDDYYGYALTQRVQSVIDISESTMYPVLRRLQKDGAVSSYDQPYMGRNRRYYRLTGKGLELYAGYRDEWTAFRDRIDRLMMKQAAAGADECDLGERMEDYDKG